MMLRNADIVVVGASLGGVLAAWRACEAGKHVVLLAQHAWLGGQMTAQGVPPDEHHAIEFGGASASYVAFRAAMRAHYLRDPDFLNRSIMTEGVNPGDGWVSRLCFEPRVAAEYFEAMLAPFVANGQLVLLRGASLTHVANDGARITHVDCTYANSHAAEQGVIAARLSAEFFLDATDTGELIAAAGIAYRLGKEARDAFDEPDAPEQADPRDQQPVTWVMALRQHASPTSETLPGGLSATRPIERPDEYAMWRRYRVPHFGHLLFSLAMPGSVRGESTSLPLFAAGSTLDWWRYRRVISAGNWRQPRPEVSLVNWAQNDYALEPLLDGAVSPAEVGARARVLSQCLLYWLQMEAPDAAGQPCGYPTLQLAPDVLGTADGFAQQVYVRESRRIVGLSTLHQRPLLLDQPRPDGQADAALMVPMPLNLSDSVGVAWYNMDIHPTVVSGHGVNAKVRPFTLPIGAFVPADCENLIPACKNISVTHLVNAATRTHPTEWLIGEVAALLAVQAIDTHCSLRALATEPARVQAFQSRLRALGIPTEWDTAWLEAMQRHAAVKVEAHAQAHNPKHQPK
jgi:hypothetical protein